MTTWNEIRNNEQIWKVYKYVETNILLKKIPNELKKSQEKLGNSLKFMKMKAQHIKTCRMQ